MNEIEALKERVDRLEAEREQEKREKKQLRSEVKELRDRLEAVENNQPDKEKEQLRDHIDELESENEDLRETVETQAQEINDLRDELSKITTHAGKERAELAGRISEVEETVSEVDLATSNPTPEAGETPLQASDLTPIEQLSRAEDVSEVTDSPTVERAVALFKNLGNWGSKTPRGIVLKPADNPLSLLEADQDESLAWKQYYRAAEALEQLSHGSVTFFDSDKHGKIICLHEQSETFDRVVNGSLTASSVGAKG